MLGMTGPGSLQRDGGYEDIYVKTADGWRIRDPGPMFGYASGIILYCKLRISNEFV
jgi:hypothetical protein